MEACMNTIYHRLSIVLALIVVFLLSILSVGTSAPIDGNSGKTPVTVEAESGINGSSISVQQDGDIAYVTTNKNYASVIKPGDSTCVVTYQVTFQDSGDYHLFVRLRVGPGASDDDSFISGRGFGEKDHTDRMSWVLINGLAIAGFTSPSDFVDGQGTIGSQIWKWVNVTKNYFQGASPEKFFHVGIDSLSKIFQISSREDGLWIDKFAFGKSNLFFTVEALDNQLPGSTTGPEPDSSGFYQGPPFAEGSPKFLGNVKELNDADFAYYWNQLTPGNEGKWGSVGTTTDTSRWNWKGLDDLYHYAKGHGLIYKHHTLIWGNQQPDWISSLDSTQKMNYIETWIRMVGQRYPEMDIVEVVNEPLAGHNQPDGAGGRANYKNALGGNGETGWDWVIKAFTLARKYLPHAKLLINDYGIINDNSATTSYLKIINLLKDRGLIDGIGVQGHRFEFEYSNTNTLKSNLDRLTATGFPIYITEMDLGNLNNAGTPNDDQQLQLYQKIFPVLWEHPGVKGITLWGYIEDQMWQSSCHLVHTDRTWRPAMHWLAQYVNDHLTEVEKTDNASPYDFKLEQNFPNPLNPTTHISFNITESANVSLVIFDILGRETASLVNENLTAGVYNVTWDGKKSDGSKAGSGTYFYRLRSGNHLITRRMTLLK
jgi:endo-1,4-beta-xylanase